MAQVQYEIDSIRVVAACPDEVTLILKEKGSDNSVRVWLSQKQGEILAGQLHGRPDSKKELDAFLADNNAADSDIECVTIHLEYNTFFGKLLLSRYDKRNEVRCPVGLALALAVRVSAPVFFDGELFDKVGVRLSDTPCEPRR
ncbi:MAG: bifunctional nuclease family protein [Dehalococcoidia bacterium]|nr:bifunctional nuclease family protein [Dehalococcoidia bacterium]